MILDSINNENEDWDLEWDYTMGDPLDNGFMESGTTNSPLEITSEGLHFNYSGSINSLYQIKPRAINYQICNEGIYETKAKIISNSTPIGTGVKLQLTNGTEGIGIYIIANNIIRYNSGTQNTYINIGSYSLNEWFKLRIELSNNTAYVYLNNNLIHQTTALSKGYMTSGNHFLVQGILECYVKSIKLKKIF